MPTPDKPKTKPNKQNKIPDCTSQKHIKSNLKSSATTFYELNKNHPLSIILIDDVRGMCGETELMNHTILSVKHGGISVITWETDIY